MKIYFSALTTFVFLNYFASAQNVNAPVRRTVKVQFITKDSVAIPLNGEFEIFCFHYYTS